MTSTAYQFAPISNHAADSLRAAGGDRYVADAKPGYPCRQCLRDAEIGEELILVSHDPFSDDSPYRSASPIFLHADGCPSEAATEDIPAQLTCRQLSVRAFDASVMMIDAAVIDGRHLDATITQMLADRDVENIHVHNASRGCWAVSITRP